MQRTMCQYVKAQGVQTIWRALSGAIIPLGGIKTERLTSPRCTGMLQSCSACNIARALAGVRRATAAPTPVRQGAHEGLPKPLPGPGHAAMVTAYTAATCSAERLRVCLHAAGMRSFSLCTSRQRRCAWLPHSIDRRKGGARGHRPALDCAPAKSICTHPAPVQPSPPALPAPAPA